MRYQQYPIPPLESGTVDISSLGVHEAIARVEGGGGGENENRNVIYFRAKGFTLGLQSFTHSTGSKLLWIDLDISMHRIVLWMATSYWILFINTQIIVDLCAAKFDINISLVPSFSTRWLCELRLWSYFLSEELWQKTYRDSLAAKELLLWDSYSFSL